MLVKGAPGVHAFYGHRQIYNVVIGKDIGAQMIPIRNSKFRSLKKGLFFVYSYVLGGFMADFLLLLIADTNIDNLVWTGFIYVTQQEINHIC